MRKLILSAAAFLVLAACCQEQQFSLDTFGANVATFDKNEERYQELYDVAFEIVDIHFDFDYFQESLPVELLNRVSARRQHNERQSLDDLVECIYYWDKYDASGDILCEWPAWDDFMTLIIGTKYESKFRK